VRRAAIGLLLAFGLLLGSACGDDETHRQATTTDETWTTSGDERPDDDPEALPED